MRESIVESVKAIILPKFIKAQHFKHHGKRLYKERNTVAHIMCTFIFYEMSRLQYNLSIGCSTIWRKYSIIIGKLRMFIFIAMEMEKLYTGDTKKLHYTTHTYTKQL